MIEKHNICINVPLSQTFRSYLVLNGLNIILYVNFLDALHHPALGRNPGNAHAISHKSWQSCPYA
jgi:hypothetical protein